MRTNLICCFLRLPFVLSGHGATRNCSNVRPGVGSQWESKQRVEMAFRKKPLDIVELTLSIGYWGMIARTLVPLQVDIDALSEGKDLMGKRAGRT